MTVVDRFYITMGIVNELFYTRKYNQCSLAARQDGNVPMFSIGRAV